MINIEKLILDVLKEENVAGGTESAFGPGVQATASQTSGDTYAPGDARIPYSIYGKGSVMTRRGLIKSKKKRKKKKKR
ncbi:hypothetical protein EBU94_04630 [bacterium]|nr:hypothetical protein [bacterium]